jgi:hypothetical protein
MEGDGWRERQEAESQKTQHNKRAAHEHRQTRQDKTHRQRETDLEMMRNTS